MNVVRPVRLRAIVYKNGGFPRAHTRDLVETVSVGELVEVLEEVAARYRSG